MSQLLEADGRASFRVVAVSNSTGVDGVYFNILNVLTPHYGGV